MKLVPVILCGGSGVRLWPLSRALFPKQLLPLTGDRSLLQETVHRLTLFDAKPAEPVVVCNEAHRFLVAAQLEAFGADPIIVLEPKGRNTAPAVAVAALLKELLGDEPVLLLVLPADHIIHDSAALGEAVSLAIPPAEQGRLITFGIVPTTPETGYGYIRAVEGKLQVRAVDRFVEKPDFETARRYVQSGSYFWNSGMFLFSSDAYLDQLRAHAPDILSACEKAVADSVREARMVRLDPDSFTACPSESIDYAVMEKTDRASVISLDAGWSDVGSWAALHEVSPRDSSGNTMIGDVVSVDCHDSYVRSESRLVTAVGLDGCVVLETKDAVLVAPSDRAQDVKKLVDQLEAEGRSEIEAGREVFRPWGSYDSLESDSGFQVKRLTVLPGAILSLQAHRQRAEQ